MKIGGFRVFQKENIFVLLGVIIGIAAIFDLGLAVGLVLVTVLSAALFFFLYRLGQRDSVLFVLFLIVLFIHLGAALFIHYAEFYPFGGNDGAYHALAIEISDRIHEGNFSLEELSIKHPYPVLVGGLYTLFMQDDLVGKLFNVWLVAVSVFLLYRIILAIGGSKRGAFIGGLLAGIYPSYLYFGSLLIREAIVICIALAALLLTITLVKRFSWFAFILFCFVCFLLFYFRFYIGFAMLFTFMGSMPFMFKKLKLYRKVVYGVVVLVILGFIPQARGHGYYGVDILPNYLQLSTINVYREVVYIPAPKFFSDEPFRIPVVQPEEPSSSLGWQARFHTGSAIRFVKNYFVSSLFALVGPFPWQITHIQQLLVLAEMIPWYILLFFIGKGIVRMRKQWQLIFPILLFSAAVLGAVALFVDNFGIYTRVRMPSFIVLMALAPLAFYRPQETAHALQRTYKMCEVVAVDISLRFLLMGQMKFLQKRGFSVWSVSSDGKWIKDVRKLGVTVRIIEITRKLFTPLQDLAALRRMTFFFAREQFDIVHTHTLKASFLGQLAALMAGVPIRIYTIHGLYFQQNSSWLKRQLFTLVEKVSARSAHVVFFDNREDMETVEREGICNVKKIRYLGGSVDMERFNPENFSEGFIGHKKRELGIPAEKKVVGIISRLVKEKGFLELFEAFAQVQKQFPDAVLLVIGPEEPDKQDGFSPDIVKKYGIENDVIFLGEQTDVVELYALMDILVLPSHREGLGLVLLEAAAMEKPVIASDIRGCREAVDHEKTGLLVTVKDPQELAKAILYLLLNPKRAGEMGRAGRQRIEREFDERILYERMGKEYDRLVKEKLLGSSGSENQGS